MRYQALATDYDGTIAHDGRVDTATLEALAQFRRSGRKLILVTGRELPDLETVFAHLNIFDRVVAENGAVLFNPSTREKRVLAERPPEQFVVSLRARQVTGISQGDVIVATWHPHETAVLESIRDLGLELQMIFNKDAVMVLPTGVNKMTGLNYALAELKLSRHNIAGVGDAENDHAFLHCCECSVAVANAIPALKERVDLVTEGRQGAGVAQLIGRILEDDLRSLPRSSEKHAVLFGLADGRDIRIDAGDQTMLVGGPCGGGKSTFVAGLMERLTARDYQVCVIDGAGEYGNVAGLASLGSKENRPSCEQVLRVLDNPAANVAVNLAGVKKRSGLVGSLLAKLQEKKRREGRPHWIVIDLAEEVMSEAALKAVSILAVCGPESGKAVEKFARGIASGDVASGEAAVWFRDSNEVIPRMQAASKR